MLVYVGTSLGALVDVGSDVRVGSLLGNAELGELEGQLVGILVGDVVGKREGVFDGIFVGILVGDVVGKWEGMFDGILVDQSSSASSSLPVMSPTVNFGIFPWRKLCPVDFYRTLSLEFVASYHFIKKEIHSPKFRISNFEKLAISRGITPRSRFPP